MEERRAHFREYAQTDPDFAGKEFEVREEGDSGGVDGTRNVVVIGGGVWGQILTSLVKDLSSACASLGHGELENVCFGILPSGPLNAHVEEVHGTRSHAVFVPSSLFSLLNLAAKLVVLTQPLTASDEGPVYLPTAGFEQFRRGEHPYVKFRHRDLLRGVFVYGDAAAALPYPKAVPYQNRFSYLLGGAELFVLAHEVGHVLLGHLEARGAGADLEFEADDFAFRVVVRHFETAGVGNALERAYLCGFLALTIVRVWERCVRSILGLDDEAAVDEHHPDFKSRFEKYSETLERLALGRKGDKSQLPGLVFVNNGISMIDLLTTPETIEEVVREAERRGGVSGLPLGRLGHGFGSWELPPRDVWNETVAELTLRGCEYEQALARWFVKELGPGFELNYYKCLLYGDRDKRKERLFREAVFALQPMYRGYFRRLKERFQEEAEEDRLEEYLGRIAGTLGFRAALDYGGSLGLDPMDSGFGQKND